MDVVVFQCNRSQNEMKITNSGSTMRRNSHRIGRNVNAKNKTPFHYNLRPLLAYWKHLFCPNLHIKSPPYYPCLHFNQNHLSWADNHPRASHLPPTCPPPGNQTPPLLPPWKPEVLEQNFVVHLAIAWQNLPLLLRHLVSLTLDSNFRYTLCPYFLCMSGHNRIYCTVFGTH